jgi:hypothetical protein
LPLIVDYFAYDARPGASARRAAHRRLLRVRHASGYLGTSRGSSSTTAPTPHVWVPRHLARLVASLVVDYFAYAARLSASAPRAARHTACRAAHRRLLHLRRASGCLGTSRGSSSTTSPCAGSSSTNSPTTRVQVPQHVAWLVSPLIVDYFAYAVRPGASTRRTARHAARRRLLCALRIRLAATLALLQPRRASRLLVSRQLLRVHRALPRRHLPVASRRPFISTSFAN